MKKEEQIKQLKTQLAELQPLMELSKILPKSHLANFVSDELATEIKELTVAIEQLEKSNNEEEMSEGAKKFMSAMRSVIYSPILDFNDVEITSYVDCHGILQELEIPTAVKAMYEEYPNVQFLGYNNKRYVFSVISEISKSESGPLVMLFFGKKKEKPLKHPHMKDIVATFCISANDEFEVEKLIDADKINWEDWDKVQPIGEDQEYGIVVKATYRKENPNQFSLFFCKKK